MSSATPAAPPTPQEINRKLSLHSTRPTKLPKGTQSESDSESIFSPDYVQPSPRTPGPSGILTSPSVTHPLSAIAEGKDQSGDEDSEEEDAEGEARQRREYALGGGLSETVIKSGYLWKKGERRKTWKKRWFVLRSTHLAYYKSSAEYRLLRLLDLSEVHSCLTVTLKKHDNSFGIVAPARTYYLQAHDQRDAQAWVTAINEQCEKNKTVSSRASIASGVPAQPQQQQQVPPPIATVTSSSEATIPSAAATGTPPIPIPTRGNVPPPISASAYSPGYGVTSSDSEDASASPNRGTGGGQGGRARSYSRSSAAVPPSPTWPATTTVASPPRAQGPAAHPEWDPTKVVKNGYLMKCGSKRRHWRKRWFVLTGEKLFYTGSHMDTKPHREITLSQVMDALEYDLPSHSRSGAPSGTSHHPPSSAFSPSSEGGDGANGPGGTHTFKIVTTKRTLLLCAPTEEEEIGWLSAVRALLARRTTAAPAPADHVAGASEAAPTTPGALLKGKVVRRLSLSSGAQGASVGAAPPASAPAHAPSAGAHSVPKDDEEKAR